jgi:Ca-activated chloride channel family protein
MVTALYEIIPNGISSQYLKEVPELKYTDPKSKPRYSEDLLTIKLRYKRPNGNTSVEMTKVLEDQVTVMSPDFGFASAVALFGMQLRKSQYTNGTNSSAVLDLAGKSRGEDRQGYRAEFVRLVKTFDGSL